MKRFISFLLLMVWGMSACQAVGDEPAFVEQSGPLTELPPPTAVATLVSTLPPTEPLRLPSPMPTVGVTPQQPVLSTDMSNEVTGWYLHHNQRYGYRISFPPAADIWLYGEDCLWATLYESGYLLITAVDGHLPEPCQRPALDETAVGEEVAIPVAGELLLAQTWDDGRFYVRLGDELQVEYGLQPDVDPQAIDSRAALAVISDMVNSLRFSQTVALPVVTATTVPTVCFDPTPAVAAEPPGLLRVRYELDGQLWEWQEETATAVVVEDLAGALSADGRLHLSHQQLDDDTFELWMSRDGEEAQLLLSRSIAAYRQQYEQLGGASLAFGWLGESHIAYAYLVPRFNGMGGIKLWPIEMIDTETGQTWPVLAEDLAWSHLFTADGRWLIALLDEAVQLIDPLTGQLAWERPLPLVVPYQQTINLTPDGQQLYLYTDNSLTFIRLEDGAVTSIALPYTPIGLGHYSALPILHWLDEGSQLYAVVSNNVGDEAWQEGGSSTVWLVDTAVGSATPVNEFAGLFLSMNLSPDGRWISFWTQTMNNVRSLYIGNVVTGEQTLYDEMRSMEFVGWSGDGRQFLYKPFKSTAEATELILGDICAGPRPLVGVEAILAEDVRWVDSQRLLILDGRADGFSTQPRPLRLVTLDGQSSLIVTLKGERPYFELFWVVEE